MPDNVLTLVDVTKRYGDFTAVRDVTLAIPRGSICGFLGPNGAGKTTTLRMILDIIKPTTGTIRVLGAECAASVRQRIGYLPEEKGLYRKMRVADIIGYFGRLKGLTRLESRERTAALLARYGMSDFARARVEALSKGMGQKVQVLAAVVHDPELVILDEPFSGLDPVNQMVLEELIRDLAARGRTVIFSTHVMEHAERLCDRILLIANGSKVFDGTVPEARALMPRRITLETRDSIDSLRDMPMVGSITRDETITEGDPRWLLNLPDAAEAQDVLRHCFDHGISLSRFEYSSPSLHDVFVTLVGSSAGEQRFR